MIGKSYIEFKKAYNAGEQKDFDVIVIGSGTGGLSVASFLAQEGKRVLVLEQHYEIGGYTHSFKRENYIWDVGLHYVGHVHIPGSNLNKIFRYISKDKLKWEPLDDVYDRAVFGETEYEFPRGRENLKTKLKEYFPDEKDCESIDKYFELLDEAQNLGDGYFIDKVLPPFVSKLIGPMLRRKTLKISDQTTLEVLEAISDNPKLIGVLTAQYGDYGLEPSKSSFYMHCLLANHYMEGGAYPVGGAPQFSKTIVPVIQEAGGEVVYQASVEEILVEGNKAVGVKMRGGQEFKAKTVVSAAGVVNTYGKLLPKAVAKKHGLDDFVKTLKPSMAHVGLYVGVKESSEKLKLPKCNYWIFPEEYDHEKNRKAYKGLDSKLPVSFASFPSAKDPEAEKTHPGLTTAEVIILVPYEWFKKWKDTIWNKRDEEYEKLKEQLGKQLMGELFRVAPQLKGKVDFYEVSTPLTTEFFSGHPKGEIYGVTHTPERFRESRLRTHTPVKNLYMSGQDVITASIAGGTMGGLLCACSVLKKNLLKKVSKAIQ